MTRIEAKREQWEALIVESGQWMRRRNISRSESKYIVLDEEDHMSVDDKLQGEFEKMKGFDTPLSRIVEIDHPIARFYRLMYTNEFKDFKEKIMRDANQMVLISNGTIDLVIDQVFRYFVFVEASPSSAYRFGQLICAIAVFRNVYDEDSKRFVENGIMKSRKRFFKSGVVGGSGKGKFVKPEYLSLKDLGVPADYEKRVANMIREMATNTMPPQEEFDISRFEGMNVEGLEFTTPLPVSTCVYSPLRKTVLHVMQVVSKYADPSMGNINLIYTGNIIGSISQAIREILPQNITLMNTIDKINYQVPTIVIMDDEFDKESSASTGDDNLLMRQITIFNGLINGFKGKPLNLLAVSMNIRIPNTVTGIDSFEFPMGIIFNTPWKNPQDGRMRLVWNPQLTNQLVNYNLQAFNAARRMVDYVIRPLIKHSPTDIAREFLSVGLIDGEFDSELEKSIVKRYYQVFPKGKVSWVELAEVDDVMVSPRFIGEEPMFGRIEELVEFRKFVIDYHMSLTSSPSLSHVARCSRSGLFPTTNLYKSPLVESLAIVFGENMKTMYETFLQGKRDRDNVLLTIREKNILPKISDKTVAFNLISQRVPGYKQLVPYETSARGLSYNFVYDLRGEGEEEIVIVQLGDSLGNTLYRLIDNLEYLRMGVSEVIYEGTFPLNDIWKGIVSESIPIHRLKNVYDLTQRLEYHNLPYVIIKGYGYPDDIFETVVKNSEKSELYRGFLEVVKENIVVTPRKKTLKRESIFRRMVSETYFSMIKPQSSILILGSEYDSHLEFLINSKPSLVFHVTESGAGGKRVERTMKNLPSRIFIQERLAETFVIPVENVTFDYVVIHPIIFSRIVSSRETSRRFLEEIRRGLLPHSKILTVDFDDIVGYLDRNGDSVQEVGKVYSGDLFTAELGRETLKINGTTLTRYSYEGVREICSGSDFAVISEQVSRTDIEGNEYEETIERETPGKFISIYTLARMIRGFIIMDKRSSNTGPSQRPEREAYEAYTGRAVKIGENVRTHNNLVKKWLIDGVADKARVCDLASGHGQDIGKWFSYREVESYMAVDASEDAILEAERRFSSMRGYKPDHVWFGVRDIFGSQNWTYDVENFLPTEKKFTAVSCQLAIHYAFKTEEMIRRFLFNVSNILSMGGEFIVTTIDEEVLRNNIAAELKRSPSSASTEVICREEYYTIKISSEMLAALNSGRDVMAGISYEFTQFPSDYNARTTTEYVVSKSYFKRLAEEVGLEMVEQSNFLSIDDIDRTKMDMDERFFSAMYVAYKFKKVLPVSSTMMEVERRTLKDFERAYQRVNNTLFGKIAERIGAFKRGVFFGSETQFPAPLVDNSYQQLDVVTGDIGGVKRLFSELRVAGRISGRENVYLSRLPKSKEFLPYDMIFVSNQVANQFDVYANLMSESGTMFGTFVSEEGVRELTGGEQEFSNYIFQLLVDEKSGVYSINSDIETDSKPLLRESDLKKRAADLGMNMEIVDMGWETDTSIPLMEKQYLRLFTFFKVTRTSPYTAGAAQPVIQESIDETVEEPVAQMEETVDRFVLLPGLVQKKAPGKGRDESLASKGTLYKELSKDTRWRFKLSDDWENPDYQIRMPSGETFQSVTRALIYYKCQFAEEEDKGYLGLNLASGLPIPEDIKPFTKAIRGKKGIQWKQQEAVIQRSIYEAKFANTPNVSNDPENLTPLRALLLTGDAQLYSNSKTRNELLENVRSVLRNIVNNQ